MPSKLFRGWSLLQTAIADNPQFAFIATDRLGVVQLFNAGAELMLGYAPAEVIGRRRLSDFQDAHDAVARAAALSAELGTAVEVGFDSLTAKAAHGIGDKFDITWVRKSGARFRAAVSVSMLEAPEGDLAGYLLIFADDLSRGRTPEAGVAKAMQAPNGKHGAASNQKRAELSETAELFSQAALAIPDALWIRDAGSKVLRYVNPAWEKLTGRGVHVGDDMQRLYEVFHLDDLPRVISAAQDYPNGGADLECRIVRPDGTVRWVHVRTFPITDGQGRIYRVIGLMGDITERKDESARSQHLKDDFVATVSHELRAPLTSIAGSLGLLLGNAAGRLPESAIRMLTIAYNNSQRLVRLIGDILDIEKIESGKLLFSLERVEVRALVEQSIDGLRDYARNLGVRIRLDSSSVSGEVCADPDRLVQVFTNLLSNAIKFSPHGQEVAVAVTSGTSSIRVTVRDHASGIPDEFKSRIFQKFAQADTPEVRQAGGSGLGLSIVHQIVSRLCGEVGFEDAPGGGTIFYVELPDWDYLGKTRSILDGQSIGARILLCEDNKDMAELLGRRLLRAGFATDVVDTVDDALAVISTRDYAVVLVDFQRLDGDRIGLIKRLRACQRRYNTLLMAVSVSPDEAGRSSSSAILNVLDWLDKPFDAPRLKAVFDRLTVHGTNTLPRVLLVDDDERTRRMVIDALATSADLTAIGSIEAGRGLIEAHRFDLAILDVAMAQGSGVDLLADLRDIDGDAIPVIVLSEPDADVHLAPRMNAALIGSRASIDDLIETMRRHMLGRPLHAANRRDAA